MTDFDPRYTTRYPVFVPSKGRAKSALTVKRLIKDGVPFRLVVEPSEADEYRDRFPDANMLITPHDEMRLLGVRNWIRDLSIEEGHARHWQIDDNISKVYRLFRGRRLPANFGIALRTVEDFTDRYTNIGLSGMNYTMFTPDETPTPFYLNCHVYSCSLINNEMPYKWRLLYNDDTDLCLQVLSGGLCTVAVNVFNVQKIKTMVVRGGNTDDLYLGDGRVKMARALERVWPGIVTTERRFQRPQHVVKGSWRGFDTPLIRRDDINWDELPAVDEYGMKLVQVAEKIKSPDIERILREHGERHPEEQLEPLPVSSVLNAGAPGALALLLTLLAEEGWDPERLDRLAALSAQAIDAMKPPVSEPPGPLRDLQDRWEQSLAGDPDYSVYDHDDYLAELWGCWVVYSRTYLQTIARAGSFPPLGVQRILTPAGRIVDLGCGCGFSTAILAELFPDSDVHGTNLPDTIQTRVAVKLGARYDFEVHAEPAAVPGTGGLVFASEYFEHFPAPVDHLHEVLDALDPDRLLVANTFTAPAIGHFPTYLIDGAPADGKATNRAFNEALEARGYRKVPTKMWNQRPTLWARDQET